MREVAFFCRRGRNFVINQSPGRWLRYLMCNLYKLGRRTFVFLNSATSLHFGSSSYIHTIVPSQTQLTSNMALPSCLRKSSFSTSWVSSTSPHCSV